MIEVNEWSQLHFCDPEVVLRDYRRVEGAIVGELMTPRIRRLRTGGLKECREARDAALFAFGMRHVVGTNVYVHIGEKSDYDFVVKFIDGDHSEFVPVQLKELVPEDLNPAASLDDLLRKMAEPRSQGAKVPTVAHSTGDTLESIF